MVDSSYLEILEFVRQADLHQNIHVAVDLATENANPKIYKLKSYFLTNQSTSLTDAVARATKNNIVMIKLEIMLVWKSFIVSIIKYSDYNLKQQKSRPCRKSQIFSTHQVETSDN